MSRPILTMDFETDPFEHLVTPAPFAVGLYDGQNFDSCWHPQCADAMVKHLEKREPSIIYMHNGGRFDLFFLMPHLEREMRIINGRIVQCFIGKHEIRDSYSLLPFPLSKYKKDEIDIKKLHRSCRELHRVEILSYLRGDCVYLHELVTAFWDEFGDYLTIGSASMNELRKFHPFAQGSQYLDDKFRKVFFYGGRVQCFDAGIVQAPLKIYDVNSMYPSVMMNVRHPNGDASEINIDRSINNDTFFVVCEGTQTGPYGAFPTRNRRGGIDFTQPSGEFAVTIHEFNAAVECGFFRPKRILKTYGFRRSIVFDRFVSHFFELRAKAIKIGDKIRALFYKYILNSAYGKFAQNPHNFMDYAITQRRDAPLLNPWTEHFIHGRGEYTIWKKPVTRHSYYNITIGASITGAARACLMRGIANADGAVYVDTDSIVCSKLSGVPFSETELGAWKLEATGDRMAIAGKKLYAVFDGAECVKKATKGARISPEEIVRVAQGETVTFRNDAPTFKLDGRVNFVKREIRRTV